MANNIFEKYFPRNDQFIVCHADKEIFNATALKAKLGLPINLDLPITWTPAEGVTAKEYPMLPLKDIETLIELPIQCIDLQGRIISHLRPIRPISTDTREIIDWILPDAADGMGPNFRPPNPNGIGRK